MESLVIDKDSFLKSENKDRFMSACLKVLVEADLRYQEYLHNSKEENLENQDKLQRLEQEYQRKSEAILAEWKEKVLNEEEAFHNRTIEIQNLQNSIKRKQEKLALIHSLARNRQNSLQKEVKEMEQRVEEFVLETNDKIAQLQADNFKVTETKSKLEEEKKKQIFLLRSEYEARKQELRWEDRKQEDFSMIQNIINKIPPTVLNSVVSSMEAFEVKSLKYSKKYIRQCKMGSIFHECSVKGREEIEKVYPKIVKNGHLEVPYIIGRNHAVYQMFLYKQEDKEIAWQHFQTICLGQLVLHRNFDYELTVLLDGKEGRNESQFLSDIRDFDKQAQIKVIFPQQLEEFLGKMNDYCNYVNNHYLKNEYQTMWEYNSSHPEKRLPYKGIALWDFPLGANEDILNFLYDMYNTLEKCGIFFIFMVNDSFQGEDVIIRGVQRMMEVFPSVGYNREVQGYEALGDRSYIYQIEEYRNL